MLNALTGLTDEVHRTGIKLANKAETPQHRSHQCHGPKVPCMHVEEHAAHQVRCRHSASQPDNTRLIDCAIP
jgi:hypothetical protein